MAEKKKLKIPIDDKVAKDLVPYDLRHIYGSNMIASGANFKDVQELMGHSDIGITLNTYAHSNERTRKCSVDLMEKGLAEREETSERASKEKKKTSA